jgi:capsule polysaccharide export protein KpsE/RkpR
LINKFNLRKVYWDRRMEDARIDLARKTDVSADRKSGIITIRVTDHSPERAAAMGREYVDQLNLMLINLNTSTAHREKVFLEERLKQVKRDLELAERNFSQFSSKNATLDMKEQSIAMVDTAAALEGQLVAAQTELQGLKQVYSDSNVRVRSVQARIDELQRQIQRVGGKAGTASDSTGQYVDSLYPTIRELPLLGVAFADLYRETKIEETTFGLLTQEYELAKVNEAKELPSVKILDEPNVPGKRSYPPRLLILFLGASLAFAFGVLFILQSESWRSIDPNDPGKRLASEVWVDVKDNFPAIRRGLSGESQAAGGFPANGTNSRTDKR